MTDPDAWNADYLRSEVEFCVSPAGRLRREDREVAFALEIERLRVALRECADDLEAEINGRYRWPDVHPAQQPQYERDMVTVRQAREALCDHVR